MVLAQVGEENAKGTAFRSSDVSKANAENQRKPWKRRIETRTLIKDSDGCDAEPLQRASYVSAGATENNLECPSKTVERRLETWTLIKDSDSCDTQPFQRVSHDSAGAMETNLQGPQKAADPDTKAAVRAIRSEQGDSERSGRFSYGPPLSLTPTEARVEGPNLVEGRRDVLISELIAEAANKKKRLRLESLGPDPDACSSKKSGLSDSSFIRLGDRQKNVSSNSNSKPGILKLQKSVSFPHSKPVILKLQKNVSFPHSKPGTLKKFTHSGHPGGGLSGRLTNGSAVRKFNDPRKFASKLVEPALKRKQTQDPGPPSLSLPHKKKWIQMPWHKAFELAVETGRAVLLQNLDPGFSSCEIEAMLTELLSVSCEARMQPPRDFSCYTSGEAFVLFQSREEAEGALIKLTENVLIWSEDQRPVVASPARKSRHQKNCFRGFSHLSQSDHPNGESQKTGGASSHCSQPNTVIFEMGMEWRLLQDQQNEAWNLAAQLND